MIARRLRQQLLKRLAAYPAVALIGPRQCGKTTLAQSLGGAYFDLEQESERLRLDLSWERLVAGKELVILDEARSWSSVFPRLRGAIDQERKRAGRFLILGSVSPSLMVQVSESLAGRLSVIELTPLLQTELETTASRQRHWLHGGYPDGGALKPKRYPRWQLDYLSLLSQRDLPTWGLPTKPQTTDRLLRMLAVAHGQIWNASRVGQSMGLSYHTINGYMDYFEGAFLIRRLQPYTTNIGKRLVKSPKVYWRDSGLLHALLSVSDERTLLAQPWVGASWQGYVIEQALGELSSRGCNFAAYYFRTGDGHKLDLLLDFAKELWAVEVKLTSSPGPDDMKRLQKAADMIGATRRLLVSQASESIGNAREELCNLKSFLERLGEAESLG